MENGNTSLQSALPGLYVETAIILGFALSGSCPAVGVRGGDGVRAATDSTCILVDALLLRGVKDIVSGSGSEDGTSDAVLFVGRPMDERDRELGLRGVDSVPLPSKSLVSMSSSSAGSPLPSDSPSDVVSSSPSLADGASGSGDADAQCPRMADTLLDLLRGVAETLLRSIC